MLSEKSKKQNSELEDSKTEGMGYTLLWICHYKRPYILQNHLTHWSLCLFSGFFAYHSITESKGLQPDS